MSSFSRSLFAAAVQADVADSVVCFDPSGKAAYPDAGLPREREADFLLTNTTNDTHFGWNPDSAADLPAGYTFVAAGDFVAPLDEQSITWTAGTTPAPAVLTVTTDGSGNATVYGWGGNGISTNSSGSNGGQNADTTYLDGFQIAVAPVPEPTTLSLIGLSCLGLLRRKSRQS